MNNQMNQVTIGSYLAQRLEEVGVRDYFAIPGDFNLSLLDELLKNPRLKMINCCNELNAGYAADGYARENGVAALLLTFGVGGLSAVNAVAGAFAEDLPVIVVSGGPNVSSLVENRILHHTLALPEEGDKFVLSVYKEITAHAVVIREPSTAAFRIDEAIRIALSVRKPVYIEIACNLAGAMISKPNILTLTPTRQSDPGSLQKALKHAAAFLNGARQPVLVAGSRLRAGNAAGAFKSVASKCAYGVACMPNAKSFFPETDPQFIGIYWGSASSPGCREVVESSDAYLFAGPIFSDYTTVGFSALIQPARLVEASPERILVEGQVYHGIVLSEFLEGLASRLNSNATSLDAYLRIKVAATVAPPVSCGEVSLSTRCLFHHINECLDGTTTVVAETGDSWFNGMDLHLPEGCKFEIQMQYGSIGWSVGAFLGLAAANPQRRVIGLIGDGSFQMTAQEVSTILRYNCSGIIFLMNNGAYTIEVMIHDGPYNTLQNWNYAAMVETLKGQSAILSQVVRSEKELVAALKKSKTFKGLTFIEVILNRTDCNKALLGWGTAVADYNGGKGKASG
ncbi:MAG: thiamine pyrophosphate-binding protein [Desulfuromonadaceae bacterium]|nr:thiamine pyrophosphate-binding protein [Desulfuromonadaceae bacterium]